MNRVITINLNGIAYQLEESGYEALREYLDNAARRLGNNPDKDEIIADIEQAIGDKFRAVLGTHKTVVITKEVTAVIAEMGPVDDGSADSKPAGAAGATAGQPGSGSAGPTADPKAPRRFYRIYEGAMLTGVCNGLAAYFNMDVIFVRIGFVILSATWGMGVLLYLVLSVIVPAASTPAEMSAASGMAATAQEFIRRAREGYYEGMRKFHDKQAHREWRRRFKREMRGWKHGFRQEMRESANQWQSQWGPMPRHPLGVIILWPVLSVIKLVLTVLMFFAVFSLIMDRSVFDVALPAGIPLWTGVVFLGVFYLLLVWPLKGLKHACYYPGGGYYRYRHPLAGLWDSLVWLGFLVLAVWVADHYVPNFHEWLQNLPAELHRIADELQAWWAKR